MFQDYSYNSFNSSSSQVTQVPVTSLDLFSQIHSGNGGINGPVPFHRFPLQGQSILSIKICILES